MIFDGVYKISRVEAREFMRDHHYLGGVSNGCSPWGYYESGLLVAVAAFGVPATHTTRASILGAQYAGNVFELQRLATNGAASITLSKFVSQALRAWTRHRRRKKYTAPYAVVSFADSGEGHHGGIYQAMSWGYYGITKGGDRQFRGHDGRVVYARINGVNHRPDLPQEKTTPKHRYIKHINKRAPIMFKPKPYPKPGRKDSF